MFPKVDGRMMNFVRSRGSWLVPSFLRVVTCFFEDDRIVLVLDQLDTALTDEMKYLIRMESRCISLRNHQIYSLLLAVIDLGCRCSVI